ncbi:hypothetical protein SKAU_G00078870 [Synaphobranchus kaupii]|uniref:Uncharacterized protein n=1 Tax=Synaphobranchus kaupii TaxID=118154 RepID=A0A9Q1FUX2_SYNKA|nr:hypothetical protein SKAU_G00078870 [Synaphobranchus kaupii]
MCRAAPVPTHSGYIITRFGRPATNGAPGPRSADLAMKNMAETLPRRWGFSQRPLIAVLLSSFTAIFRFCFTFAFMLSCSAPEAAGSLGAAGSDPCASQVCPRGQTDWASGCGHTIEMGEASQPFAGAVLFGGGWSHPFPLRSPGEGRSSSLCLGRPVNATVV